MHGCIQLIPSLQPITAVSLVNETRLVGITTSEIIPLVKVDLGQWEGGIREVVCAGRRVGVRGGRGTSHFSEMVM